MIFKGPFPLKTFNSSCSKYVVDLIVTIAVRKKKDQTNPKLLEQLLVKETTYEIPVKRAPRKSAIYIGLQTGLQNS